MIMGEMILEIDKNTEKKSKILDVGGHDGAIKDFLPGYNITIADIAEDKEAENYVQCNGANLPFADGSFDIVISCDVLEHVVQDDREDFIKEMLRVTNNYFLLCAPFETERIIMAEKLCDSFYKSMTNESYIWLKEHRKYVLPRKEWLEGLLDPHVVNSTSLNHTSLGLWTLMLCSNFFLAGNIAAIDEELATELRSINEQYLQNIACVDFTKEGYRTFFIASKETKINVVTPSYDEKRVNLFFENDLVTTGKVLAGMTKKIGSLLNNNKVFENIRQENDVLKQEYNAIKQEIFDIKNSRRYKISERVGNIKNKLIGRK